MMSIESDRDHRDHRGPATRQAARDLATAVHELRTPLATVQGFLETLDERGDELDPEVRDQIVAIALRNARVLGGRIDALLAYEQLESVTELEVTSASLGDLLARLVEDCSGILTRHQAHVQVPADTWVAVDADALSHVVANLVANAVRHSPPGTTITVSAEPREAEVVVTVADQGEGIAPEDLPHVFEPFYRGDGHPGGGTGLGLAVVRRYVDRWGGTLDIDSEVGVGTRVSFSLPRVPAGGTVGLAPRHR